MVYPKPIQTALTGLIPISQFEKEKVVYVIPPSQAHDQFMQTEKLDTSLSTGCVGSSVRGVPHFPGHCSIVYGQDL